MKQLKKVIILSVMFFGFAQLTLASDLSQHITVSESRGVITNNSNMILRFNVTYNGGKTYTNYYLCPGESTNFFHKPTKVSNVSDVTNNSSYSPHCK